MGTAVEWVTAEDAYECTLSKETQQISKEELREDKNTRDQALEQIRNWIKLNPRIQNCRLGETIFFLFFPSIFALSEIYRVQKLNCRDFRSTDARFLLRFLRCKKFNVPMAEEAIERYLLLRQVYHPAFNNLDITEPTMEELLSLG